MDRQDIDALLIGALYGELTPADEARLAAHLESHPADRGALDDLKVARQAVLDSRIFAVQLEPPQAVSALLLQEAHRRAPKRAAEPTEKESWFARFAKSFMAHPAMAAAAMLVLVMGGAGVVWMKKGDQLAEHTYSQSATERAAAAPQIASEPVLPEGNAAVAAGSAYGAGLYEGNAPAEAELALGRDQVATGADGARASTDSKSAEAANERRRFADEATRREEQTKMQRGSLEVTTADRAPKDFEAKPLAKNDTADDDGFARDKSVAKPKAPAPAKSSGTAATTGRADTSTFDFSGDNANAVSGAGVPAGNAGATSGGGAKGGYAQPPPPPAPTAAPAPDPAPVTRTTSPKKAPPPAQAAPATTSAPVDSPKAEAPTKEAKAADDKLLAWARSEHMRAVALAKNGKCTDAARVALVVSNRASSYYAQHMSTDRSLKPCAQYITAEREREAERNQKASKRAADEPATTK